jgi:hypothetical protein
MTKTETEVEGIWCVSCYPAKQMVEAGQFVEEAQRHVLDLQAVVVLDGNSLCRGHLNMALGFPADFPDVPLPDAIAEGMADEMEDFDRKARKMQRSRERGRSRRPPRDVVDRERA